MTKEEIEELHHRGSFKWLIKNTDYKGDLLWFPDYLCNESNEEYSKKYTLLFNSRHPDVECRVMSNHGACDLLVNDLHFNSVEQLYFVLRFYEHPDIQAKLMRYREYEVHGIGNKFAEDCEVKFQQEGFKANILLYCIRVKMKQCKRFRDYIYRFIKNIELEDRTLQLLPLIVEYCSYWKDYKNGTVDKDASFKGNWEEGMVEGQNRCGKMIKRALVEYRKGKLDAPITLPYDYIKLFNRDIKGV